MIPTLTRCLILTGLALALTACSQHKAARANCFNFRDASGQAAPSATTLSTKGAVTANGPAACDFVMLGAGS